MSDEELYDDVLEIPVGRHDTNYCGKCKSVIPEEEYVIVECGNEYLGISDTFHVQCFIKRRNDYPKSAFSVVKYVLIPYDK